MRKWRYLAYLFIVVILIAGFAGTTVTVSRAADSSTSSIVIGRLTGTIHPLPGFFYMNDMLDISEIEIEGFRVVDTKGGRKASIRPGRNGYFAKKLDPGTYTLRRNRRDRPNYKDNNYIDIVTFDIGSDELFNLGTIELVFDGPPTEYFAPAGGTVRGEYLYSYRYRRAPGSEGYRVPLARFQAKRSKQYAALRDNLRESGDAVTSEPDSSMIVLVDSAHDSI